MTALIQRVSSSYVKIETEEVAAIGKGYNILLGVMQDDTEVDIEKLVNKIVKLRIFPNEAGKMDKNIVDVGGEVLVVSQFTLAANLKRGTRPDFNRAMKPDEANRLYELFKEKLGVFVPVQSGVFGAMMEVGIVNDGPVTIIVDSRQL
ncbi:MAG: D-aminoacyl-tRNA deacylase [Sulfurovum sp.]|nr:D-aminoacyl-tRNA deacylase [Sulfurovum sp.]